MAASGPEADLANCERTSVMVDESVAKLDSTRIKPLIDALKIESGGHGGLAAEGAATAAISGKLDPHPALPRGAGRVRKKARE